MVSRILCLFAFCCLVVLGMHACSGAKSCKTSLDCAAGQLCYDGTCGDKKDGDTGTENPTPSDTQQGDGGNNPEGNNNTEGGSDQGTPTEQGGTEGTPGEGTPPDFGPGPQSGQLIINEVLYSPPTGNDGDANKDGARDSTDDEFVELVNTTNDTLHLGGVTLQDDSGKVLFTFPQGIKVNGLQAVVIFGGGMDSDTNVNTGNPHPNFGNALVFTTPHGSDNKTLSLTNSGKVLVLKNAADEELSKFEYGTSDCPGGKSESVTLTPDMTGTCGVHTAATTSGALFSPGTRAGGTGFDQAPPEPVVEMPMDGGNEPPPDMGTPDPGNPDTGTPDPGNPDTGTPDPGNPDTGTPDTGTPDTGSPDTPSGNAPGNGDLIFNEVFADPATGTAGDANKDGTRETYDDEFVEIVNVSNKTLQLQGVTIVDNGSSKVHYTFGALMLPAGKAVVVFGGGMTADTNVNTGNPHPNFGNAYVYTVVQGTATSGSGLGLSNTSDHILLKNAQQATIAEFKYPDTNNPACVGNQDQSMTLDPDLTGTCKKHKDVNANSAFSPGTKSDGTSF